MISVFKLDPGIIFQRFYRFLEMKSKNPEAAVPPLDQTLKAVVEPDVDRDRSHEINFSKHFVLKEAVKVSYSRL